MYWIEISSIEIAKKKAADTTEELKKEPLHDFFLFLLWNYIIVIIHFPEEKNSKVDSALRLKFIRNDQASWENQLKIPDENKGVMAKLKGNNFSH